MNRIKDAKQRTFKRVNRRGNKREGEDNKGDGNANTYYCPSRTIHAGDD